MQKIIKQLIKTSNKILSKNENLNFYFKTLNNHDGSFEIRIKFFDKKNPYYNFEEAFLKKYLEFDLPLSLLNKKIQIENKDYIFKGIDLKKKKNFFIIERNEKHYALSFSQLINAINK